MWYSATCTNVAQPQYFTLKFILRVEICINFFPLSASMLLAVKFNFAYEICVLLSGVIGRVTRFPARLCGLTEPTYSKRNFSSVVEQILVKGMLCKCHQVLRFFYGSAHYADNTTSLVYISL